ncbi:hypothetical protein XENOCAPTIV_029109 [Xenoophorus captivus]|uniref:Rho-GAP domain-containing protein n=1 Tax=Xenoophorus captivus TaxID=1517983 RepID=A0ABV0RK35_9TELE
MRLSQVQVLAPFAACHPLSLCPCSLSNLCQKILGNIKCRKKKKIFKNIHKSSDHTPVLPPTVFGKSLIDTLTYEQRFGPHTVPILVQKCADFIIEHGLKEEGIFRLPGQDNTVKQFRDAFDAGERPSFPR